MVIFDLIWGIEDSLMVARPLAGNNKGLECVVCHGVSECVRVRSGASFKNNTPAITVMRVYALSSERPQIPISF